LSLGKAFRAAIFGESHGPAVGALVEGCPPGVELSEDDINKELSKRRPGGRLTSPRSEADKVKILSGVFLGYTTGAPILLLIENLDVDSSFYEQIRDTPRPGHADYPARVKYRGFNDYRGGGIFSGRITAGLVAAGAVAKKLLSMHGIKLCSYVVKVGAVEAKRVPKDFDELVASVEASPVRCPDPEASAAIAKLIEEVARRSDSVGAVVETVAVGLPVGLGEPPVDTLDGDLAKAVFVVPGVKGIEFGAGFEMAEMLGSEANDEYVVGEGGKIELATNKCGGVLGGLSAGSPLVFRVVFKPTPTIRKPQRTVDVKTMSPTTVVGSGRHDPCIAIRGSVAVEAATAIVLADHLLRWAAWRGLELKS